MVGRCRGPAAGRGTGGGAVTIPRMPPPTRRRPESSPLPRLVVCLALLTGGGHALPEETKRSTEETKGGTEAIESAGSIAQRLDGIAKAAGRDVGVVVARCNVKGEGSCGDSAEPSVRLATGAGGTAKPADAAPGEAANEPAGHVTSVGACSGRRFKKCR